MITELLNIEQLDLVAGGSRKQYDVDRQFFSQLCYNMERASVVGVFAENGVLLDGSIFNLGNDYSIKINGEWCKHPHWAALGYVLSRRNYPGFTGKWTDSKYVHTFLKEHFCLDDLD